MTLYVISLSPELQHSASSPVSLIEAAGGILAWENVWLIDSEEHPSHKFRLVDASGAFTFPVAREEFSSSVGPKCTPEARKFLAGEVPGQSPLLFGSKSTANTYKFINGGDQLFGQIIEKFELRQQESITKTSLCEIMSKSGSDKGLGWHNYTQFYSVLFEGMSDQVTSVFEVGLGTNFVDVPSSMGPSGVPGASLRGWRTYFPGATIYGGDVDQRILFSEDRIQTFFIDQLRPDTLTGLWQHMPHVSFDIFIDDGLHELEAGINTFRSSFDRVRPSGFYVIEDVKLNYLDRYVEFLTADGINAVAVELNHPSNTIDNCVIVAGHAR